MIWGKNVAPINFMIDISSFLTVIPTDTVLLIKNTATANKIRAVIPLGVLYVMYEKAVGYVLDKFYILSSIITFLPVKEIFHALLPIGLVLGIGIGYLGSSMTTKKHLKV